MFSVTSSYLLAIAILFTTSIDETHADEYHPVNYANFSSLGKQWLLQYHDNCGKSAGDGKGNDSVLMEASTKLPDVKKEDVSLSETPWFVNLPVLSIVFATSPTLPDGPCKRQAQQYLQALRNGTLWAVQMYDASATAPYGIISGNTKYLGSFDQCYHLSTTVADEDEEYRSGGSEVRGRYCLVDLRGQKSNAPSSSPEAHTMDFNPNDSAWELIREKGDFRRVKRYQLQMALCVPATCSATDVQDALREPLERFGVSSNIDLQTSVKPEYCQALQDEPEFSYAARFYCYGLLGLLILVIASSRYDSSLCSDEDEKESTSKDVFLCFSARRNLKSIFETSRIHPGLDCIHFVRSLLIILVICGHRMMQYYGYPVINADYLELVYTIPASMFIFNGTIIVDGFFAMGGLLVSYGLLEMLDKKGRMNYVGFIFIRFLRLTPMYFLVVLFHALILPHLGSGPYWKVKVVSEGENCAAYWWANILYINNFVKVENLCMFQSWYLSVDYHIYIAALFTVYAFWRSPRSIGYPFLAVLGVIAAAIPFYLTYTYNLQPIFLGLPHMRDVKEDRYFTEQYVKTHMRFLPYLIGIIAGAIIYDHKSANWRLPKLWARSLFILLVGVLLYTCLSLSFKYYDPNAKPDPLESAFYASLHRGAFAVSTCSIPVLITVGDGLESHHNFLTPAWVQPIARLSYGAFLVHNVNQMYDIGVARTAATFSFHNMVWDVIPDILVSLAIALVLSIMVEGPVRKIEKRFITRRMVKSSREKNNTNSVKKIS